MMASLKEKTAVLNEKEADVIVINSCTVTNSADTNARHYINQVNRLYPNKKILLTGCSAYSKGESLLTEKKVFGVFGHREKESINALLSQETPFFTLGDLNFINEKIVTDIKGKTRAFIKIQEGCDFECAYCIIPQVRGKARSQKEEKILSQIKTLAQNGFSEFVLTGINMGSYGKDTNTTLSLLLEKIFKIHGVKRVRLGSLEPSQVDGRLLELIDEPLMEKHLHIALQHTDDEMLRIMNRRNRTKKSLSLFETLADKGVALGTDFIVGHPSESEERWKRGLDNFKKFPLTHAHLFSYSKRDNTASAVMPDQINGNVAKERLKILEEIIKKNNFAFRKSKKSLHVLVENQKEGYYYGHDQYFNKIAIQSDIDISNSWITVDAYEVKDINYAKN